VFYLCKSIHGITLEWTVDQQHGAHVAHEADLTSAGALLPICVGHEAPLSVAALGNKRSTFVFRSTMRDWNQT
jgi:hypothetical protein